MNIMTAIKKQSAHTNTAETENGAFGYKSHESAIVDFFYKVSSMRQWEAVKKQSAFLKALGEDRELAFRMLFYIRDIRKGLGERQLFRDVFEELQDKDVLALIKLVPEYGRWDDVLDIIRNDGMKTETRDEIVKWLGEVITDDLDKLHAGKNGFTLLAKWLPSIRKVNKDKVKMAKFLAHRWGWDERTYRRNLADLRSALRVVERTMSEKNWGSIDFGSLPSKAAKNYRQAFMKHDEARYRRYLDGLSKGTEKVNAGALFPYELVHEYTHGGYSGSDEVSDLIEAQWKALPLPDGMLKNAIVVRDGSGSMTTPVSGRSTALDVATALAILMSENLKGEFKDKFITFSEEPRFVDLSGCNSLQQKVKMAMNEAECANTNIERTMNLILDAAIENGIPQEEIPTVVIVSDMEFDSAIDWRERGKPLFKTIGEFWNDHGYKLPKIVFWNVNSRTGVVPLQENENGLVLVSGFSQNILDMLTTDGGTMLDIIRKKVSDKRYDPVAEAIR